MWVVTDLDTLAYFINTIHTNILIYYVISKIIKSIFLIILLINSRKHEILI